MKLYNSFSGKTDEFTPIEGNKVKMYVCGPTVMITHIWGMQDAI